MSTPRARARAAPCVGGLNFTQHAAAHMRNFTCTRTCGTPSATPTATRHGVPKLRPSLNIHSVRHAVTLVAPGVAGVATTTGCGGGAAAPNGSSPYNGMYVDGNGTRPRITCRIEASTRHGRLPTKRSCVLWQFRMAQRHMHHTPTDCHTDCPPPHFSLTHRGHPSVRQNPKSNPIAQECCCRCRSYRISLYKCSQAQIFLIS